MMVRITQVVDSAGDASKIGKVGVVTFAHDEYDPDKDDEDQDLGILVIFPDGSQDSFWTEEVEEVDDDYEWFV